MSGPPVDGRWATSWGFPSADTTLPCSVPPLGETCEVSLDEVV